MPAHDWYHVQRVEAIAETLVDRHSTTVNERVVTLAVVLDDVGAVGVGRELAGARAAFVREYVVQFDRGVAGER